MQDELALVSVDIKSAFDGFVWSRQSKTVLTPIGSFAPEISLQNKGNYMKRLMLVLLLPVLAACVEDAPVYETDISEANRNTACPVDVSEADRANYPACN